MSPEVSDSASRGPSVFASRGPEAPPSGLLHPLALAAIALLVVNDHVLKARYPGWLTGKLSDVAGLVFFPLLLRALLAPLLRPLLRPLSIGRERLLLACVAMTALAFAAIKLAAPATAACEHVLAALQGGGRAAIVRDPTDLLALPCVLAALWIARRVEEPPAATLIARQEKPSSRPPW
jgi:hypothetical protein